MALLKKLHIKWVIKIIDQSQVAPEEAQFKQIALWKAYVLQLAPEKVQVPDIDDISIIYLHMEKKEDWNTLVIDNIFSFQMAIDIIRSDEDPKVETINECQHRKYWPKWKEYIKKKKKTQKKSEKYDL